MRNQSHGNVLVALTAETAKLRALSSGKVKWPPEFKSRVAALVHEGIAANAIARGTGINRSQIDRWRREAALAAKPAFSEIAVVRGRGSRNANGYAGEKYLLLRTPRGFVASLSVAMMADLCRSGVL